MRTNLARLLVGCLIVALAGCPRTAALRPAQAPAADLAATRAESAAPPLSGRVELSSFRVQAPIEEVANGATVSLMDPDSGQTISTTLTDGNGEFSLEFSNNFAPETGRHYILEAVKGLSAGGKQNRAGASVVRVRSAVVLRNGAWESISGSGIVVSGATTALMIIFGLKRFVYGAGDPKLADMAALIGSVSPPDTFNPGTSNIALSEFQQVLPLVRSALAEDQDPVFVIGFNANAGTYSRLGLQIPLSGVTPTVGRIGQTSLTIYGSNFAPQDQNAVLFNGYAASGSAVVVNSNRTQLTLTVPKGATTGPLAVQVGSTVFAGPNFRVLSWDGHTPFDQQGNLYVSGGANNSIWRVSRGGALLKVLEDNGLNVPRMITLDGNDNLYVANAGANEILKIASGSVPFSAGQITKLATGLSNPHGLAFDRTGALYVANYGNGVISRIPPGGGAAGTYASGLNKPVSLAFDTGENLIVGGGDSSPYVMQVATGSLTQTTLLDGNQLRGGTIGVAFDTLGALWVAVAGDNRLLRRDPVTGIFASEVNLANLPGHQTPYGIAADTFGNLMTSGWDSHSILRLDKFGVVSDLATTPRSAWGMTADAAGNLYVPGWNWRRFSSRTPANGRIYKIPFISANNYGPFQVAAEGFQQPSAVAFDSAGLMYVADRGTGHIYKVNLTTGYRTTYIRGIGSVTQMDFDSSNTLFASRFNSEIARIQTDGTTTYPFSGRNFMSMVRGGDGNHYAASWRDGFIIKIDSAGNNTKFVSGGIGNPSALAWASGQLWCASWNGELYKFDASGNKTTVATGLGNLGSMAQDASNFYLSDWGNGKLRKIAIGGASSTEVASQGGIRGVGVHPSDGNLYFAATDHKIRRVSKSGGAVSEWADMSDKPENYGSNGPGLFGLVGITFDGSGNLYASIHGRWQWTNTGVWKLTSPTDKTLWAAAQGGISNLAFDSSTGTITTGLYSSRNQNGPIGVSYKVSDASSTRIGTLQWRTMGVQVNRANGDVYSLTSFWGVWYHINKLNNAGTSWSRHVSDTNAGGGGAMCGALNIFREPGSGKIFLANMRCSEGVIRLYNADGTWGRDYSAGNYPTGVYRDGDGNVLVVAAWGGPENTPLHWIPNGKTSAEVMRNWFYRPVF